MNVGVVSFAGSSAVVAAPSTDHAQVQQQISTLQLAGGGTAIGESVFASVDQIEAMIADADGEPVPSRVVVLSDGSNTAGRSPDAAAEAATRGRGAGLHHRVRDRGRAVMPNARAGTRVPVDGETLAQLADATGGTAYTAETGEELRDVYTDIGSSIGWRTEQREVTPYLAALALLISVGAGALSLRWFSRLI